MPDKENNPDHTGNLENEKVTPVQKQIEDDISEDEDTLTGEDLSAELSKDRTHMSEHRTRMSEHRTDLSEKRTGLSEHRTDLSEQRTSLSDERTALSYQRTALSYERTLMSWVRTATSMISFGFTIYKFFEEIKQESGSPERIFTPRIVGLTMISFGFISLLLAHIQHHIAMKKIRARYQDAQRSISSVLSFLILVFGMLLFLGALFRQ